LARERAALGDDADLFATPHDHAVIVEDAGEDLLGGDDKIQTLVASEEISGFTSSFPPIESRNEVRGHSPFFPLLVFLRDVNRKLTYYSPNSRLHLAVQLPELVALSHKQDMRITLSQRRSLKLFGKLFQYNTLRTQVLCVSIFRHPSFWFL
jgi:hypothetical protein